MYTLQLCDGDEQTRIVLIWWAGKGFKSDKSLLQKVGKHFRTLLHNYKFGYFYWQFYFQIKLNTTSWSFELLFRMQNVFD